MFTYSHIAYFSKGTLLLHVLFGQPLQEPGVSRGSREEQTSYGTLQAFSYRHFVQRQDGSCFAPKHDL